MFVPTVSLLSSATAVHGWIGRRQGVTGNQEHHAHKYIMSQCAKTIAPNACVLAVRKTQKKNLSNRQVLRPVIGGGPRKELS